MSNLSFIIIFFDQKNISVNTVRRKNCFSTLKQLIFHATVLKAFRFLSQLYMVSLFDSTKTALFGLFECWLFFFLLRAHISSSFGCIYHSCILFWYVYMYRRSLFNKLNPRINFPLFYLFLQKNVLSQRIWIAISAASSVESIQHI